MEISSNIIIVGATEGQGILLLIKKEDLSNSNAKCVSVKNFYETKTFDNIQNPLTFNAFNQLTEDQSSNLIALLNRKLEDGQIETINNFLINE